MSRHYPDTRTHTGVANGSVMVTVPTTVRVPRSNQYNDRPLLHPTVLPLIPSSSPAGHLFQFFLLWNNQSNCDLGSRRTWAWSVSRPSRCDSGLPCLPTGALSAAAPTLVPLVSSKRHGASIRFVSYQDLLKHLTVIWPWNSPLLSTVSVEDDRSLDRVP